MIYEGDVYRPPSEARSLIMQITIGCANNTCTFCSMYKAKKFRIRTREEIFRDFDEMSQLYGDFPLRIFLADGDALTVPTELLLDILGYIKEHFPNCRRVTSYATAKDIIKKGKEDLKRLRDAGLSMVYVGAESGDGIVLKNIKKNINCEELIEASRLLKETGIQLSLTLISGMGGRERMREHAIHSANLVTKMKPEYLGFLTLMLEEPAPLIREIQEGKMELLRPEEVVEEMRLFLTHVDSDGTVFRSNHPSNYFSLRGTLNQDIPIMLDKLSEAEKYNKYRDESFRML
ncbi:MAG: radical SAM protein [Eubacteriales bacterium]|nr:radical SAM protein [Eubacteriales bacterium]